MKKILSLIMALTMLVSVLCCVPVSANLYEGYPYLSLDFEDKDNVTELQAAGTVVGLSATWKAEGANGTLGCLSLKDNVNWGNPNIVLSRPLVIGRTYRLGFWVRVNLDDFEGKKASFSTIIYTQSAVSGKSAYKSVSLQGDVKPNEWCYVSTEFLWDGYATDEGAGAKQNPINPDAQVKICPRLGSTSSTLYMTLKATDKYKNDNNFAVYYDLDDVVIEPATPKEVAEEGKYDDSYTVALDFEDGKTGGVGGGGTKTIVNDPERGKVLQNNAAVDQFNEVTVNGAMEYNHLYKISAWIKRTDDLCEYNGSKSRAQMITWLHTRTDKENVTKGVSYPAYFTGSFIEQNKWYYIEIYQKFDVKTFDDYKPMIGFRLGNRSALSSVAAANPGKKIEEGEEGVVCLIDDFFVQDMGIIANADFESEKAPVWYYQKEDGSGISKESNVFGWLDKGATSKVSNDVRTVDDDETVTSTKSMEVTVGSDGGHTYQGIKFDQKIDYHISFWAKGADLADGEEVPMSLVLDRKVDTVLAQDVYNVPDYEKIGDNWMLTNQWQKFEVDFSPEYVAKSAADSKVLPRTPFLYFEVDGNKAGTKYLIDDLQMVDAATLVPEEAYPYPKAELIGVDAPDGFVEGAEVTFEYNFISEVDNMEGESVIRILASEDGKNFGIIDHVIADYGFAKYIVPSFAVGKTLKAEILPVDMVDTADGKVKYEVGDILPVEMGKVKKAFVVTPEITKWDEENGEVAAQVYFETNMLSRGDQNVVAILAVYDENNTLIGMAEKAQTVVVGEPVPIKVSASLAGVEGLTATHARLFVWKGTSIADAGESIYANAVLYPAN